MQPAELGPIHTIVPLNVLEKSKARLSRLLLPTERAKLTAAMLADVLSVLRKSRKIRSVTVVSADKSARGIARRFGADFVWEGERRGLNKALRLAIRNAEQRGAAGVLVIHADLPLLTPREVDRFLTMSRGYPIALAPSRDGVGTNALLLRPPNIIRPAFGKGSFRRHLSLAEQKKLRCKVLRFAGFSFDVDEPKDLHDLMRYRIQNETIRFLRRIHGWNRGLGQAEKPLAYGS